ncbi:MAG: threonylcarbamoyl-AMP synthase, partial [Deltaproteobacteria bacterium]|nr:threonylcarbamoyl-AMP synthase [Deltaproteobacteria bacterium]
MKKYNNIIKIDPDAPQPDLIQKAADFISKGDIVTFPTFCLYGLAADAFSSSAVKRVFEIKRRSPKKPLLVLIKNRDCLLPLVKSIPRAAETIMDRFWPGRITLVFEAKKEVPELLTAGTGKIGIRMPSNKVAAAIVNALENPIIGTSANISDQGGSAGITDLPAEIIRRTSLVLDAGLLKGGTGSTVIDITTTPPEILREGEIQSEEIYKALKV